MGKGRDLDLFGTQNQVFITQEAKLKQDRLVALVPAEIGWVGIVEERDDFVIVTDILVPEQEVSGASVDYSDEGLHNLIVENIEDAEKLKYFGHSHVNMAAYFSSTDMNEHIQKYYETGGYDYIINHVQNKRGESSSRIDVFEPVQVSAEIEILETIPTDIDEWAREMVKEKVTINKTNWSQKHKGGKNQKATILPTNRGDNRPVKYIHNFSELEEKGRFVLYDNGRRKEYCDGQLISDQQVTSAYEKKDKEKAKQQKGKGKQGKGERERSSQSELLPYDVDEDWDEDDEETRELSIAGFYGLTGVPVEEPDQFDHWSW